MGNLPAVLCVSQGSRSTNSISLWPRTLGQTGTQDTGNLTDQSIRSDEGVVLASKLLDNWYLVSTSLSFGRRSNHTLLVLVQLLEVVSRHGVDAAVLGTIDIVLVTEDADAHVRAGDSREADSAGETLVTLGVIVLEADLEPAGESCQYSGSGGRGLLVFLLDGLEEVALLGLVAVLEEISDVLTHTGCEESISWHVQESERLQ